MKPVPSPKLVFDRSRSTMSGELGEAAKRGREIFNSDRSGCFYCHPEPLFTDKRLHDVGTKTVVDSRSHFDTPTLIEVWRTAPYLHDGRYRTIRELIVEGRHVDMNGRLGRLEENELDDLIEYILSL